MKDGVQEIKEELAALLRRSAAGDEAVPRPPKPNDPFLLPPPLRTRLSQSSREVTCGRPCGYHACTSDIYPVTAQKGHGDMFNYTLPMSMTMLLESLTAVGFLALAFLS